MKKPESNILCVYCLRTKPRPKKGEHIILDGLGGHATIKDVCLDCNHWLGNNLDIELLRNSHFAYYRYFDPNVQDGQVGGAQFVPFARGGWLDAKVFNSQDVPPRAQVCVIGTDFIVIRADEDEEAVEKILEGLKGVDTTFEVKVSDEKEYEPARLVIDMAGKSHFIRARTLADAQRVKDAVKKGYSAKSAVEPLDTTGQEILLRISTDLNIFARGITKMAFNMAVAVLGVETMTQPSFHPVRAYILGTDVQGGPVELENGDRAIAVDQRYLDQFWKDGDVPPKPDRSTTVHAIRLDAVRGKLGAKFRLFGGAERFVVRLGPLDGVDQRVLPRTLERRDDDDYWGNDHEWVSNTTWANLTRPV